MSDSPRRPAAFVFDAPEQQDEPQRKPRAITGITFEPEHDEGELIVMPPAAVLVTAMPLPLTVAPLLTLTMIGVAIGPV